MSALLKKSAVTPPAPSKPTENMTYQDLVKAVEAYHSSPVVHSASQLMEVLKSGHKMQQFEIEMMRDLIKEFDKVYNTDLAKALE